MYGGVRTAGQGPKNVFSLRGIPGTVRPYEASIQLPEATLDVPWPAQLLGGDLAVPNAKPL